MITFDPKTGLIPSSTEEIRLEVTTEFRRIFGVDLVTEASTPAGQLVDSFTAMIATKETEFIRLANQFNPYISEGVWQDAIGYIYFLDRKVAQPTLVTCQCMGLQGVTIPQGSVIKTADNIFLTSLNEATFPPEGTMDVLFATQDVGPVPVAAESINTIVTVVPGWDTVINLTDGVLGRVMETRDEFERRRYASVSKNAHGTVASLYGSLADLDSVIDVLILENRGDDPKVEKGVTIAGHSVYISIFGGLDDDIAKTIYNKIDAGCGFSGNTEVTYIATDYFNAVYNYAITRPDELPFFIKVNIKLTDGTPADIETRIKNNLIANFNGLNTIDGTRVGIGQEVFASRFYCTVLDAGIKELVSLEISLDNINFSDFVSINADRFPTLSNDNITIIMQNSEY